MTGGKGNLSEFVKTKDKGQESRRLPRAELITCRPNKWILENENGAAIQSRVMSNNTKLSLVLQEMPTMEPNHIYSEH